MKITSKLKPISELKSLPTFEYEYDFGGVEGNLKFVEGNLKFAKDSITAQMLNKSNVKLKWDKKNKRFLTLDEKENYQLEWLDTLTFTDDSNRFAFELKVEDLEVTVKPIHVYEVAKLSFKDKFSLRVSVHSYCPTALYDNMLALVRGSATTKNFKSQKELTKFIGRLCRATL